MSRAFPDDERLVELLVQQATTGLDAAEAAELEARLVRHPQVDREAFERTVAALTLAARLEEEPLPGSLRTRVLEQEAAWAGRPAVIELAAARRAPPPRALAPAVPAARGIATGWWAAAAALLLAIAGWYPRFAGSPAPTPAELRARLLESAPGAVHWAFVPSGDPGGAGASGDVVWDPGTQRGYLRLHRLPPNDPARSQYQLWIFDGERDDRYPVDGGVFDVPAGSGEVVVPITARLRVGKPALFAITVEHPGGVVVSAREHIVVLAKPAGI